MGNTWFHGLLHSTDLLGHRALCTSWGATHCWAEQQSAGLFLCVVGICLSCLQTEILLISASWVAKITGVRVQSGSSGKSACLRSPESKPQCQKKKKKNYRLFWPFFFPWWHRGLNLRAYTWKTGALPFEPHLQFILLWLFLEMGISISQVARITSMNHWHLAALGYFSDRVLHFFFFCPDQPHTMILLCSWDYRCAPLFPYFFRGWPGTRSW
jgi:hypothetical protein